MDAPVVVLAGVPLAIVLVNSVLNRTARLWPSPASPHVTPFATGAIVNGTAIPLFLIAILQRGSDTSDTIFGLLYVVTYVNCLVFFNWFVFAVTDASMHVHLLVEIRQRGVIRPEELRARYNKAAIIRARLPRLLELKQLRLEDGRLYAQGSAVLLGAQLCLVLRRILGIPPRPEDAQGSGSAD